MCNNLQIIMLRFIIAISLFITFLLAGCSQFNSVQVIDFDKNKIEAKKLNINSEGVDYAPFLLFDGKTLFFVSNREGSKLSAENAFSHDFWFAKMQNIDDLSFSTPEHSDKFDNFASIGINTLFDEGSIVFSQDGKELFFTACGRHDDMGGCDLYYSKKENGNWSMPINLNILNSMYWDAQPTLTSDGSTLYFVSTRPINPKQKLLEISDKNIDLWVSHFNIEKNEWEQPKNFAPINTPGREMSPFICKDDITLIFASDYYQPNYGGLDLYITRYDKTTNKWSKPENLGKSINTSGNEFLPAVSQDGKFMIYTSVDINSENPKCNLFYAKFPESIIVSK